MSASRRSALAILALPWLWSAAATAQVPDVRFDPAAPLSTDLVEVTVTYWSLCAGPVRAAAEVEAATVRITAFERCGPCPLAPAFPASASVSVGPLPAGVYRVEAYAGFDPFDPSCFGPPFLVAEATLEVAQEASGYALAVEPPAPTTADPVTLVVSSGCPASLEEPVVSGHLVRVVEVPPPVPFGAPCFNEPHYEARFDLGQLPAGDYVVMLLFDDGVDPPVLLLTGGFQVTEEAGGELLLGGGRFRVTATWTRRNGASGAAQAVPLTDDTGAFWFLDAANLELMVKVLDHCAGNGHFWFFASGLTNLGVEITVEDRWRGQTATYANPLGRPFAPIQDLRALVCP